MLRFRVYAELFGQYIENILRCTLGFGHEWLVDNVWRGARELNGSKESVRPRTLCRRREDFPSIDTQQNTCSHVVGEGLLPSSISATDGH